jgi:crotonobetainyl-CoA:carnitine CoA-transferase CaiB-like acyl-CoA transferase
MQRLLDGTATQTNGALTWANVFREAAVPRATANRAKDVLSEWHAAITARTECVDADAASCDQLQEGTDDQETKKDHSSAATNHGLRRTVEVMATHIQAITLALRLAEKETGRLRDDVARLQAELAHVQGAPNVVAFPSRTP